MNKPIKTEADYKAALARADEIFDAKPGTSEGDELELLVTLIEHYEDTAFPIDLPDPGYSHQVSDGAAEVKD